MYRQNIAKSMIFTLWHFFCPVRDMWPGRDTGGICYAQGVASLLVIPPVRWGYSEAFVVVRPSRRPSSVDCPRSLLYRPWIFDHEACPGHQNICFPSFKAFSKMSQVNDALGTRSTTENRHRRDTLLLARSNVKILLSSIKHQSIGSSLAMWLTGNSWYQMPDVLLQTNTWIAAPLLSHRYGGDIVKPSSLSVLREGWVQSIVRGRSYTDPEFFIMRHVQVTKTFVLQVSKPSVKCHR